MSFSNQIQARRDRSRPLRCCEGWLLLVALSLFLFCLPTKAAHPVVSPALPAIPGTDAGEILLGELNCVACHQAPTTVRTRLAPRHAPHLTDAGTRLTPQFLRAFLNDPQREKAGTTMPDLLHGMPQAEKAATIDALVQYLASLTNTAPTTLVGADPFKMAEGRVLYHQVGCVACHAPQEPSSAFQPHIEGQQEALANAALTNSASSSIPLGNLARKTTVEALAAFLKDPLKARPSGRMPSLNLTDTEANTIAMYLLRSQAPGMYDTNQPLRRVRGLRYEYYESDELATQPPQFEKLKPKETGVVDKFTIAPRKRDARIAFHFSGYISIPTNGVYTFYTESDDGSRLYIGTNLVVRNDGYHAMTSARGNAPLAQGDHLIRVLYFNGDADFGLKVSFEGPGLPKQEIPPAVLSHPGQPMVPLGEEQWAADPAKAARGRQLFGSLGCASCHQIDGNAPAVAGPPLPKPLMELPSVNEGCLSESPKPTVPNYSLSPGQRSALQATLRSGQNLSQPLSPSQQVNHTLAALNCFACHTRDGKGGPTPERLAYFAVNGPADLGDEGRIPPHLTRVGSKLRPEWMREVLVNHGSARPYMATRMPQFGEANVGHLASAFEKADDPDAAESPAAYSERDAKFGWKLVGRDGLVCISCHTFDKYKSLGIPAMDLSLMTRRLKKAWFTKYLPDPAALRPGTRMPSFWPEGVAVNKDILGGDTDRQIQAIWTYLSQGPKADVPVGLVQGKIELIANNEAVIYRNFIEGAGARAIGVGYPEKANLAFDANDLRLALIWQGPFIDASRHRTDRGAGPEPPLGDHVIQLPPGAPFAVLTNQSAPWPIESGKKAGYQMKGYRLDPKQRPIFLYSFGSVRVQDYPVAVPGEFEAHFERKLTLNSDQPPQNLWFRAAVGSKIEPQKDGVYQVDEKVRIKLEGANGAQPVVRRSGEKVELLLPVRFNGQQAAIVETFVW